MSENRIQIRHGAAAPTSSDLLEHELGYSSDTQQLYINDSGNIINLAHNVPVSVLSYITITAGSSMVSASNTPTITTAYYCNGFVSVRIACQADSDIAPAGTFYGQLSSTSSWFNPLLTVYAPAYYAGYDLGAYVTSSGQIGIKYYGSNSLPSGKSVHMTFTYPCGGPPVALPTASSPSE